MNRISIVSSIICAFCVACSEPEISTFGSIAGVVVDATSKDAISGVKVTLTPGGTSQLTGKDGSFTFEELESQEHTLSFIKDNYESENQKVMVRANMSSNVQIALNPIQPILSVNTNVLSFGNETSTLAVDITNTGKGVLNWTVSENIGWISCSPDKGETGKEKSTLVVTADRSKLEQGNYSESFVIGSNGGSATIVVSISVNGIKLNVEPSELDFGTLTNSKQLLLTNTGSGSLHYIASASKNWLTLSKDNGSITKSDYVTAIVSREGLSAGHYDASIVFSTDGGEVTVPVKMDVAVNETPTVTVESVSDIKYNSALFHGTIISVGSDKITRYGFCWSETVEPSIEDNYSNLGDCTTANAFESIANNLKSETKYYFKAYAENSVGLVYSEKTLSFTTNGLPSIPGVVTGPVDNVTATTARAKGTLTSLGNVDKITHYGHVWGISSEPTLENEKYTDLGEAISTSTFLSELSGLLPHTTYYIRAYATNEKGTVYGEEISFVTSKSEAQVLTSEITDIVHNAATCGGIITETGGHTIIEKGVCYGKTALPTINDSRQTATSEKDNTFSCRLNSLEKESVYYVRAYIKSSDNTIYYGNDRSFKTTKEVKLPTLSEINISNIQTTSANFVGSIMSDGNSEITECGFCWSDVAEPTIVDNIANCDPQSNEMGKNITSLKEGTRYFVRSFAKNAMGYAYSEVVSFETKAVTKPEVTGVSINNVGRTTAYVSASIISDGNAHINEAGFCWSVSPAPTVYDNKITVEVLGGLNAKIIGLPELSTIYIRAYAANEKGLAYGETSSFSTNDIDFDLWDGTIADTFGGGSGVVNDPIIISLGSHLALLAKNVSNGSMYPGVHFKLSSNIDLSGIAWTPIGSTNNEFAGIFWGEGHTVSGINCHIYADYAGLFGKVSGTIDNLSVKGNVSGYNYVGGICGASVDGMIQNCSNYCDVSGLNFIGGVSGYGGNHLHNCVNYGTISGQDLVGGITSYWSEASQDNCSYYFDDCANYGEVFASSGSAGGIIGKVSCTSKGGTTSKFDMYRKVFCDIRNCANYGHVNGTYAGGICGYASASGSFTNTTYGTETYIGFVRIINSINNATVQGANYGALVGHAQCAYSSSRYWGQVSVGNSYWLYDISSQIGNEKGIGSTNKTDYEDPYKWYIRANGICSFNNTDLLSLLNNWVNNATTSDSSFLHWKYETVSGYSVPVFER